MGSSFLTMGEKIPDEELHRHSLYDEYGFWAEETAMSGWFRCLALVIGERTEIPDWLGELRDKWAISHLVGTINDVSGDYITTHERKAAILEISKVTLQRLLNFGGDFYAAFPATLPECECSICREPLTLSVKAGTIEIGVCHTRLVGGMKRSFWPAATIGLIATEPRDD